jgi:hypothetical protein
MRDRRRRLGLACLGVILTARIAAAQSLCQATESVNACLERMTAEIGGDAKAEATKVQTDVKKKTETGLQDINGLSSSVKDFLPLLQLTGVLGAVQKDDTTGTVSIALNTPFLGGSGKLTDDPSFQLKAVVETTPKLFDELRNKLPTDKRDALEKSLLASKTDAQHTTLHASYNFTSDRLGRNFARHMSLYNDLFQQAVAGPTSTPASVEADVIRKLIQALGSDISLDNTLWAEIPEAKRIAAQQVLLETVQAHLALQTAFAASVKNSGLDLFGQLINNQPQLSITVYRSFRDDLYGPDLFSSRITFEMGLANNLNGFFDRYDPRQCRTHHADCLKEYSAYLKDAATRANIKAGSRLAAYAEFIRHAKYHYANADAGLDVAFDEGTTFSAGLDYGRLLGVSDTGAADGRVDASLRYERRSDAPDNTRFVASVTITKKLGDLSIPFGIVYANKPRFLTGVDKGLTANVGLKFNLFPGVK